MRTHLGIEPLLDTSHFPDAIDVASVLVGLPYPPEPDHRLLAAVLEDAARAWGCVVTRRGGRAARLRRELREWFLSDAERPLSFVSACRQLGLDRLAVRARLGLDRPDAVAA